MRLLKTLSDLVEELIEQAKEYGTPAVKLPPKAHYEDLLKNTDARRFINIQDILQDLEYVTNLANTARYNRGQCKRLGRILFDTFIAALQNEHGANIDVERQHWEDFYSLMDKITQFIKNVKGLGLLEQLSAFKIIRESFAILRRDCYALKDHFAESPQYPSEDNTTDDLESERDAEMLLNDFSRLKEFKFPRNEANTIYDLTGQVARTGRSAVAGGGYSTVWIGEWQQRRFDTPLIKVAIKTLRPVNIKDPNYTAESLRKRLVRESNVWLRLKHSNIVPFFGWMYERDSDVVSASLISPWYPFGNVIEYLKIQPSADRRKLCIDVSTGLAYLHTQTPSIVHGDMKPQNVLVDSDGRAALCDFGLSTILDGDPTGFTNTIVGGTPRYLSPELVEDDHRTTMSDVYACASMCTQVLLDLQPYPHCSRDGAVFVAIDKGQPPYDLATEFEARPELASELGGDVRSVLSRSWSVDPLARPTIDQFLLAIVR